MDLILIILGFVCLLAGLVGCILPVLPGTPLSYVGLLLFHFTDKVQYSTRQLIVWGLLVLFVQLLDYITPLLGAKYSGGSKWGNWGTIFGTLVGLFVFPPWGILFGPFAGAVLGELVGGKDSPSALKAGCGAFIGFLVNILIKVMLCGYFIYWGIKGVFF